MLKDGKRKKILRRKKNIEEEDGLRKKISHLPKEREEHMPKQSQSNENAVSFIFLLY